MGIDVDSGRLLASSVLALVAMSALLWLLLRGYYWSTPEQRSVTVITAAVTGLAAEEVVRRMGMPDSVHFTVAATLYLVIAVAAAYRFKVLLGHTPRDSRPRKQHPPATLTGTPAPGSLNPGPDAAIMWRSMRRLTLHIQQMSPCDNPDCNAARQRIIELTAQLERGHRA